MPSANDPACPFCNIAASQKSYPPAAPPPSVPPGLTNPPSYMILSTPTVMAFLDIMPLSPGHILLCPRRHAPKLTDATAAEARALGQWARILSAALSRATGVQDWNVLQNNGAAAAQVVPHMHIHIIPRPEIRASGRLSESFTMFGRGQREELDDEKAESFAGLLRDMVAEVVKEEEAEGEGAEGEEAQGGREKTKL